MHSLTSKKIDFNNSISNANKKFSFSQERDVSLKLNFNLFSRDSTSSSGSAYISLICIMLADSVLVKKRKVLSENK